MTKIFLSCTISVGLAPLANYYALGTCTTYERIYIYIYIKNIYIYMTKIFLSCTISVGLAPLANYYALAARARRTNVYIYIYI